MSKKIDSEEEYQRRKELLEKHRNEEGEYWKSQIINKPIQRIIDPFDFFESINDIVDNKPDSSN